ncbi:hypothetical protein NPS58_17060 [Pseudomonas putida]|uniref:hypothetical protein n=1 Tax=Pseudomonas putida TaxID=303 RepID=UPI0023639C08|nr:hypothetical protein [Pseudomonas putida]MDD2059135.1 hypothetical protein [Pseudomonas putida]
MNQTNLQHALAGLLIMALIWGFLALFGVPSGQWVGAAAGVFFFLGREYTHGERKLAHDRALHLSHLRWYDGLRIWRWSPDGRLDLLFPLVACLLAALVVPLLL